MDPERPPQSVRGNEPPWAGRPGLTANQLGSYKVNGSRKRYVEHVDESRENAYDLGMMNRDENGVDGIPLTEKGLLEIHRWTGAGDPLRTQRTGTEEQTYSLRSFTDRHRDGIRHKVLWQNVKMPMLGSKKQNRRAAAMGGLFGRDTYDIVAMCEFSKEEYLEKLADRYADEYGEGGSIQWNWTGSPPSDMGGAVAETRDRTVSYSGDTYDSNFGFNKEGWQRFDIELPSGRFGEDVGFEIFSTHLDAYDADSDRQIRRNQVRDLVDIIKDRQTDGERAGWPKIVVGDLNIHSTNADHTFLLEKMSEVDMQDAWQTHGGPARRTGKGKCDPKHNPDEEICQCKNYHKMGGNRIDYVFVERPKESHEIHLDISRMWRTAWHKPCYTRQQMGAFEDAFVVKDNQLTDHHGIGFELLTSPQQ